ncbi:DEAD-domain-containing protein [Marasmius fiardii PR-910]|nr:DEAD-domain-containing protein [Marasmius fiardii PR-910]
MRMQTAFAGPWSSLPTPLTPWILDVIDSMGHTKMTPVQASTIPLFMKHKDVVVEAVTGSGKTLAFVVPVLERLIARTRLRENEIGALIISPTRELATQIHSVFLTFLSTQPSSPDDSSSLHPPPLLLVSSQQSSPEHDIQRFLDTGADIVIGTPGRIEEFLLGKGRNTVNVKELEVLVLDEADRLLDLGFQKTLTRILTHLPKQRRTGLFSATMTDADAISELVRVGLRNPARIVVKVQSRKEGTKQNVEERRIPANLQNFYITCRASEKTIQLARLIFHETSHFQSSHFIVFFATGVCVDHFYRILPTFLSPNATLHSLHGHLTPSARSRTLEAFSSSVPTSFSPAILLCTDVAARGLDLPHVDVVIQYDPPSDAKAFSHRCGRTARAGRSGRAYSMLVGREEEYVDLMAVRRIPLKRHSYIGKAGLLSDEARLEDEDVSLYLSKCRKVLLADRALHDQAAKAFVSFVRAYSKHEASYIFRVKDLDFVGLAKSYGLLRLPKMPELKDADLDGWEDADVDWNEYSYTDTLQEAKRQTSLLKSSEEKERARIQRAEKAASKKANAPWSRKIDKKEEREKRKQRKANKKKWTQNQESARETDQTLKRSRGELEDALADDDGDDWDDLAREERMAKKVRKGEVSQKAFDSEFADL